MDEIKNFSKIPGYNVFMGRVRNLNEQTAVMERESTTPDFWDVDNPEDVKEINCLITTLSMMIN